ncbi:MAG: sensor histidine kinase PhyK [Caulobacteraceae bacterium]
MRRLAWGPLTIRLRLGAALAIALMPVLMVGAVQSVVAFRREAEERRTSLIAAAERSASVARARMQAAEVLLETLDPAAIGDQCSPRLAEAMGRSKGFANLIRLDADGRVSCAAGPVGADPGRAQSPWFQALKRGEAAAVARLDAGPYAKAPAVLMAVRAPAPNGRFGGALVAVTPLDELKPDLTDRTLPPGSEVALADSAGRYLLWTDRAAFAPVPASDVAGSAKGADVFHARDLHGAERVYAAAPLMRDVTVVLSAPDQGLFSWAKFNPWSSLLLPIAAFCVALACVWVAADRVVVRWLAYLDRIAAIYARGRFTVRPLQAERAPPEVRALAHTLDIMAETIAGRDQALRDNLAQKDALMREIHHRVKNNLQVITSLLNMQQRALSDPAARAAMSNTRQRIGALALIYRALYQGPDLKRVDLRSFLEELIAQVLASEASQHPAFRTELEADDLVVDPDKLAPIALFAVEAISNAQKHAFGPQGGSLHVRFTLQGEEGVLEISDEGGRGQPPELTEGVGRTLMTAFARQLRGKADIAPNARGGVTVRLVFPAPEGQIQAKRASKGSQAAA